MVAMVMGWMAAAALGGFASAAADEVAADRQRIQRHLAQVEAELRATDPGGLSAEQRAERARNLDRLHGYWTAGVFPRNDDFTGTRVPYFIDDGDRACAVGHLMIASGADELAARIRRDENNAKLLAMDSPGLTQWVAQSGLTAQEHARIQPAYCDCPEDEAPVCATDGRTYLNECYATTCAGFEVAHEGACAGEPTTGWPEPGTSTDGSGSTTVGGEAGSGTTSDAATTTTDDAADGPQDGGGSKGCDVGERPRGRDWLGLVVLALALRTRRR